MERIWLREPDEDKYAARALDPGCAERIHICRAVCCRLPFPLARQDVDEGIIQWDAGQPYLIAQDTDGYCVHLDRERGSCTVHAQRPRVCRTFTCQGDTRIWLDYDAKVLNPATARPEWPFLAGETGQTETS